MTREWRLLLGPKATLTEPRRGCRLRRLLHAAQYDATRVAVIDQMGIDIISDGEQRRVN